MKLGYLAFTDKGYLLALRLAEALGGEACRCGRRDMSCNIVSLKEWTAKGFYSLDGLVFVGAAGIAVRAVAPHAADKTRDPAVAVVDECGKFAVSLLSGHLGGGNDLVRRISEACGAVPVITTATDANGVFAVDEWAKRQECCIANPERIKDISSALLNGGSIDIRCFTDIAGDPPAGVRQTEAESCHVLVDVSDMGCGMKKDGAGELPLRLIPRIAVLGIGCRKGSSRRQIEECFMRLLAESGLDERAVCAAASIDIKKDENGILEFCGARSLPFVTFTAAELGSLDGEFSASGFVESVTGVDNVCERSAVAASGGELYRKKLAYGGVTMAVALKPYYPDWRWTYE